MGAYPPRKDQRILAAALVGTVVEYYDFYLFGFAAALVFGPLFFPAQSPAAQTLASLLTFGLAYVARPAGAVAFGHVGDRIGRKSSLVMSMLIMGTCTVSIAFLPTYGMAEASGVGWFAPALLLLLRFGQGLGLGGEMAGATLLAIEHASPGWKARYGAAPIMGATIGNIVAAGMFLLMGTMLTDVHFVTWGWRLPFLASAVLVATALWVRLRIAETPEFRAHLANNTPAQAPLTKLIKEHKVAMLAGIAGVIGPFGMIFMAGPFALAEATGPLNYSRERFLAIQVIAMLVNLPAIMWAARHAERHSPGKTIISGAGLMSAAGLFFGVALGSRSLPLAALSLCSLSIAMAAVFVPISAWLAGLFPVSVRYSGFAFSYSTGSMISGALFPTIAVMMSAAGWFNFVGLLLSGSAVLTIAAVCLGRHCNSYESIPTSQSILRCSRGLM